MAFTHLHVHSDYSLLDGASKLPELCARVKELGQNAIALTDHGVMHGAIKLIKECQKHGLKPIIGNEMYIINQDITKPYKGKKYHLIVLAKNTTGYRNLCKLTSIAHLQGWQGKGIFARPCINKELLQQYSEGLIILSACLGGEIPQMILQGKTEEARAIALWYKQVFGEDFYLEIQDHGIRGSGELGDNIENLEKKPDERVVNKALNAIALELGIKLVATNDSHYTCFEDKEAHQALLCINTGSTLAAPKMKYTGTEYVKSEAEMLKLFSDHLDRDTVEIAINNSQEIANKVEPYDLFGKNRLPSYEIPQGETALSWLKRVTWEGLKKRFNGDRPPQNYIDRAKYELEVISGAEFEEYFLVVSDYMKYAKSQNIPTGSGRGSSCGSLVAYALEITNVDPIHHGLLFERFLNPERKSMPDVDSDFCIERRGEVIQYVTEKYGANKVVQIATFNTLAPRQAIKDTGRVLGVPFDRTNLITDLVPVIRGIPTPIAKLISDETPVQIFKQKYDTEPDFKNWIDIAGKLEGTHKASGVHAAGVIISREPLDELVPLTRSKDGGICSQYDMGDVEALGLLKMDFLGLKNLTVIQQTINFLAQQGKLVSVEEILKRDRSFHSEWQCWDNFPKDVQEAYLLAFQGKLDGVFQLESPGMRQLVRDLTPTSIDELSLILALYRPGILDAGLLPTFVNRKSGREEIKYLHSMLEPILQSTFGIPVYQEQVMKIAQELADYSLGEADLLRRAMGKKKPEEMAKQKDRFLSGCKEKGISNEIANSIFSNLEGFAQYGFNYSHSAAYAYTSWQTLYLKANYPVEFMASLLSHEDDTEKIAGYISACKDMGVAIVLPDINKSEISFTPDNGNIRFGLGAIRNVGNDLVNRIITERRSHGEYTSLNNFCDRTPSANKRAVESLIYSGAFDSINSNRAELLAQVDSAMKLSKSMAKDKAVGQLSLFNLEVITTVSNIDAIAPLTLAEQTAKEKEMLGVVLGETVLSQWRNKWKPIAGNISEFQVGQKVSLICEFSDFRAIYTKNGDLMCFLSLADGSSKIPAVMFPETFKNYREGLRDTNAVIFVSGKVEERKGAKQLVVSCVQNVSVLDCEEVEF